MKYLLRDTNSGEYLSARLDMSTGENVTCWVRNTAIAYLFDDSEIELLLERFPGTESVPYAPAGRSIR